jgi:hypothetical protein
MASAVREGRYLSLKSLIRQEKRREQRKDKAPLARGFVGPTLLQGVKEGYSGETMGFPCSFSSPDM